jgi:hypothetical protein
MEMQLTIVLIELVTKKMKFFCFILLLVYNFSFGQTNWRSNKYNYSFEIPSGFHKTNNTVGANVDFKAVERENSIVVVIKKLPIEVSKYSIWYIFGDLKSYGSEWEEGAREFLNKPKFVKYGKTQICGLETFWYDYSTENPYLYSKTYQLKKNNILYTITLTCSYSNVSEFSATWFRFKNSIKI